MPLRACVPRSVVCASSHTHLYSRNTSKTVPRRQGLPPASVCSTLGCVTFKSHTSLFSRHVKDSSTTAGLAPASVCSTLGCVTFSAHTSLFSRHVKDRTTTAGLAPCERVFHAQVCAFQITHISVLAARQRQCHDGRAYPCERVFHAQVCALQITHISILAARQRQCHDGRACPLRAWVPRSGVCTSAPSHLYSPSASEDRTTTAGLAPASVCFTLRCVHVSTYSPCIS